MPYRLWDKDGKGFSDLRGRRCVEDPRGVTSLERAGFLLLGIQITGEVGLSDG